MYLCLNITLAINICFGRSAYYIYTKHPHYTKNPRLVLSSAAPFSIRLEIIEK